MEKKVIVGIVSRPIYSISNRNMLGVYETYIRAVVKAKGIPLIISPTQNISYESSHCEVKLSEEESQDLTQILDMCDALILPGGDDPFCYDYEIVKYALKKEIPVLGICLGMQTMCSLNENTLRPVNHHYLVTHDITLKPDSKLYQIFHSQNIQVNSRHKEQVKHSGIYQVVGMSNDQVIEAVELSELPFHIGVQWHPEDVEEHAIIFEQLIEVAKKQKR